MICLFQPVKRKKQKPDKLSLFWLEMKVNKLDVGQYVSLGQKESL